MGSTLRRLGPIGQPLEVPAAYEGLELGSRAPRSRPYVVANMVAALDGRATVRGRSSGLSSAEDQVLFGTLRSQVDAVMVGTATLRIERYGPLVRAPEARARRRQAGLSERPPCVILSRTLELPLEIPLFQDAGSDVVVITPSTRELAPCPARVEVIRLAVSDFGPAAALRRLREQRQLRSVLCEGGPRLLGTLIADDVLDELFLTLSPLLVGGSGPTIVTAAELSGGRRLELVSALHHEAGLFLRYRVLR
ncbi:MAG: pyrimidine reductase family protein [Solirubrobacterales bacterium]|nr:MAG: pyrimidine reductase family protein [Solirubrobacterales bacterium]